MSITVTIEVPESKPPDCPAVPEPPSAAYVTQLIANWMDVPRTQKRCSYDPKDAAAAYGVPNTRV